MAQYGKRRVEGARKLASGTAQRIGPVSEQARQQARQVFDEVFAEEDQWPAAS
ncbi:hypothetical protein [Streptomyces bauhiniae]